jgi:2-oxo-3-hexenedioate decarboxylase
MLAEELIELHEAPRQVPLFSVRHAGMDCDVAYAAARALHEHRLAKGWRRRGRKIGFTNRNIWPLYGVYEPIWGTVYDRTLTFAGAGCAEVSLDGLVQPRIEPEICFGFRRAPRSSEPGELLDSIGWIAHSIEIVQCHHAQWKLTLADSAADNGLHGALIVGEQLALSTLPGLAESLPSLSVALSRDGTVLERGTGSNVLGSPLLALSHLVSVLARMQPADELEAGEIVTTGTLTDAHPVAAGELWSTQLQGLPLGGLAVRFK